MYKTAFSFCVTHYVTLNDWISGLLCKMTVPSHGEPLNIFRKEKFQTLCLQQLRGIASSLVPTAQEEAIMRKRVQTQLSLRGNGRGF